MGNQPSKNKSGYGEIGAGVELKAEGHAAVGARALVLAPTLSGKAGHKKNASTTSAEIPGPQSLRAPASRLEEAVGLAAAIHLEIVSADIVNISQVRPATLMGGGKVEEIAATVEREEIELVVVDHALTPIQQRNLERAFKAKVIDRTGLILEIFGARARTAEGRLQVELAHLNWQKSRLVRSWTHLERQRGGFGFLGGPGESQIEADRRLIQERISRLEKDLEKVRRTRDLHRKQRRKIPQPVVALVGYTNAGKSSIFNALTSSDVFAKNLLFATLDPTLRRIALPHGDEVILSDTVGFISELPTHLIAAFRATLEEVLEADLILHVRDISHEDTDIQAADVSHTLDVLGLETNAKGRIIEVWNKIDRLDSVRQENLLQANSANASEAGAPPIAVSALTGAGLGALVERIEAHFAIGREIYALSLPVEEGALLAWLYHSCEVLERQDKEDVIALKVRVADKFSEEFRLKYSSYMVS